ncbi:MAG: flagellar hook-length control protein FliK [bacterium]
MPQVSQSLAVNAPDLVQANDAFSQLLLREVSAVNSQKSHDSTSRQSAEDGTRADKEQQQAAHASDEAEKSDSSGETAQKLLRIVKQIQLLRSGTRSDHSVDEEAAKAAVAATFAARIKDTRPETDARDADSRFVSAKKRMNADTSGLAPETPGETRNRGGDPAVVRTDAPGADKEQMEHTADSSPADNEPAAVTSGAHKRRLEASEATATNAQTGPVKQQNDGDRPTMHREGVNDHDAGMAVLAEQVDAARTGSRPAFLTVTTADPVGRYRWDALRRAWRGRRPARYAAAGEERELRAVDHKRPDSFARSERDAAESVSSRSRKDSEGNSLVIDVRDQRRERANRAEKDGVQDSRRADDSGDAVGVQRTRPVSQAQTGGESGTDADGGGSEFDFGTQSRPEASATNGDTRSEAALRLAQTLRDGGASDIVRQAQVILRNNNEGELRLLLKPESLGTVRIRMEMVEDRVALRIYVDNEAAGDAFRSSIADLQRSFEESGIHTGSVEVTVEDGGQGDSGEYAASDETPDRRSHPAVGDEYNDREYSSADVFGFNGSEHSVNVMA